MRQIRFFKTEIQKTNNWKGGVPHDPQAQKHLCTVTFLTEQDERLSWVPEKWEVNLLVAIARNMVKAEDLNFPLLKNPEPRPDIRDLRIFLNPSNLEEMKE